MSTAARPQASPQAHGERARPLAPDELAWVALLPCALLTAAAVALLAAPLGHVLFGRGSETLWPQTWWAAVGHPEPAKHAGYLLATLAPLLLAATVLLGWRRRTSLSPLACRATVLASKLSLPAVLAVALLGQQGTISIGTPIGPPQPIFAVPTLAVAAALTLAALAALRVTRLRRWIARMARETAVRRRIGVAVAATVAAAWLLETVASDRLAEDNALFNWTLNDAFAVLDGRTPLVDYRPFYGKLMPYPAAAVLEIFGRSGLAYTLFLATLSVLALVAVYAILRRITASSLLALGLFLPFVALSDTKHIATQAALWPMRYGFGYLVAWLTARHLDGRAPRRSWVVFLAGALGVINSVEFGIGALGGTVLALLCVRPPRTAQAILRLGGELAAGALAAVALVSVSTLAGAGRLPDPAILTEWPHIFTSLGLFSLPMRLANLHLAVYATFAATIVVAVTRALRAERDVLTGMLAWSGFFGLAAGNYYISRPEPLRLVALFSAWGFSLVLLTVMCGQALAERGWRRPTIAESLVLLGFAVGVCSFVQIPSPLAHLRQLGETKPLRYRPAAEAFVRRHTRRGERVAILLPEGDRIAYDLGLDDVSPYAFIEQVVTLRQLQLLIDTMRREHVRELFLPAPGASLAGEGNSARPQVELLEAAGYPTVATTREGIMELRAS